VKAGDERIGMRRTALERVSRARGRDCRKRGDPQRSTDRERGRANRLSRWIVRAVARTRRKSSRGEIVLDRKSCRERRDPDHGYEKEETTEPRYRNARTRGSHFGAEPGEEEGGREEHDREHVVVGTLIGNLRLLGCRRGLGFETVTSAVAFNR